jgi:hypothetical protein
MLRDNLCDEKKILASIQFKNETIEESKSEIIDLEEDIKNGIKRYPRDNEEIIDATYFELFKLNFDNIRANYSCGNELSVLKKHLVDGIDSLEKTSKDVGYIQMIWMIALGILLEVDSDILLRISKIAERGMYKDALLDYLLGVSNIGWKQKNTEYEEENPYAKTADIIQLGTSDSTAASKRLQTYIEKEWLKGHYAYEWKNAHKKHGYLGFWSLEAAAIAKIFNLDDEVLKKNNRYPYDLRHYKNDMAFNLNITSKQPNKIKPQSENIEGIKSNPDLEKIIPVQFHTYIEEILNNYKTLSNEEFYTTYSLNDIWFSIEEYIKEKDNNNLLGTLLVFLLTNKGFIFQLDWKDDLKDFIGEIKNYWPTNPVDLVHFEINNDKMYYAYIPKNTDIDKIYEVKIIQLENER